MKKPKETFDERQAKLQEKVENMILMDDELFCASMTASLPAARWMLRTILDDPDLEIEKTVAQQVLPNLSGITVRPDMMTVKMSLPLIS